MLASGYAPERRRRTAGRTDLHQKVAVQTAGAIADTDHYDRARHRLGTVQRVHSGEAARKTRRETVRRNNIILWL